MFADSAQYRTQFVVVKSKDMHACDARVEWPGLRWSLNGKDVAAPGGSSGSHKVDLIGAWPQSFDAPAAIDVVIVTLLGYVASKFGG